MTNPTITLNAPQLKLRIDPDYTAVLVPTDARAIIAAGAILLAIGVVVYAIQQA